MKTLRLYMAEHEHYYVENTNAPAWVFAFTCLSWSLGGYF
jgi:hypothetical protein